MAEGHRRANWRQMVETRVRRLLGEKVSIGVDVSYNAPRFTNEAGNVWLSERFTNWREAYYWIDGYDTCHKRTSGKAAIKLHKQGAE